MGLEKVLPYERTGNSESDVTLVFLHGSTMSKGGLLPVANAFATGSSPPFDIVEPCKNTNVTSLSLLPVLSYGKTFSKPIYTPP